MENNQEQFTYAEYQAFKKVSRIMGGDEQDGPGNGTKSQTTDNSDDQDPSVKYRAEQRKRYDEQQQKLASITKEQISETDKILDSLFLRI